MFVIDVSFLKEAELDVVVPNAEPREYWTIDLGAPGSRLPGGEYLTETTFHFGWIEPVTIGGSMQSPAPSHFP